MVAKRDMPATIQRSPAKAQETWGATHDAAVERYGDGERAHRTAFASLKRGYEKVGDHWEPKEDGKHGPSDERAEIRGRRAARGEGETAGGVDANATKQHLMERAREAGIRGRSRMTKAQLVDALQKANDRATAAARRKEQS
jgi:hypothetical protein